jgi:hypothetical protein
MHEQLVGVLGPGRYRVIHVTETGCKDHVTLLLDNESVDDSSGIALRNGFHIHRLQPIQLLLGVLTPDIVGVGPAVVPDRTDVDEARLDRLGFRFCFCLTCSACNRQSSDQQNNQDCQYRFCSFHSSLRGFSWI